MPSDPVREPVPPVKGPPNVTWADLKQLGWALLLVYPFIALTAYFARGVLGARTALWFGIGLALLATAAFATVISFSLIATYIAGIAERFAGRSRRHGGGH